MSSLNLHLQLCKTPFSFKNTQEPHSTRLPSISPDVLQVLGLDDLEYGGPHGSSLSSLGTRNFCKVLLLFPALPQMYLLYGSLSDSINNANSYRALTQPGRKDRPL